MSKVVRIMSWIIFAVFLMIDLITVLICGFAYGKKDSYQEGMLFGVHVPQDALEDPKVRELTGRFSKGWKLLQTVGLLAGAAVCFLNFVSFTAFLILWCVWLFGYMAGLYYMIYHTHRRMYRVKMERGWIREDSARIVRIDTDVSAMADQMPISWKWHLPALILLVGSGTTAFFAGDSTDAGTGFSSGIFSADRTGFYVIYLVGVIEVLSLLAFHFWVGRRPNAVYSQNSEINFAVNMLTKRAWTRGLVISVLLASAATAYLSVRLAMSDWFSDVDFFLYILCQMLTAGALLMPVILMRKRRGEILAADAQPLQVDDDEYWKNGWYSNPYDSRLFVQDRMSDMNFTMNMARPAAKAICTATAVLTALVVIFAAVVLIRFETAEVSFVREGDLIEISAAGYKCEFALSDVKSAELFDQMPDDTFRRVNGGSTDRYDIGHYRGRETGKCMMFLYRGYEPILKIQLEDQTVFVNSRQEGQTEEWFELLRE